MATRIRHYLARRYFPGNRECIIGFVGHGDGERPAL